jgi:cation-transporting ATPase 13A1
MLTETALYPLLYYTYYHRYEDWVVSEEWTFIYCVLLFAGHALTFLTTAWSTGINQRVAYTSVSSPYRVSPKLMIGPNHGRRFDR